MSDGIDLPNQSGQGFLPGFARLAGGAQRLVGIEHRDVVVLEAGSGQRLHGGSEALLRRKSARPLDRRVPLEILRAVEILRHVPPLPPSVGPQPPPRPRPATAPW